MELTRHSATTSLRAAGRQPDNNEKTAENQPEGARKPIPKLTIPKKMVKPKNGKPSLGRRGNGNNYIVGDDNNSAVVAMGLSPIPPLSVQPIFKRQVLWKFNAVLSQTAFTLADGANQFLVTTNTTGNLVCYADAWRLKRLDFYLKDSSSDETVQISFAPQSSTTDNFLDELPRSFQMASAGSVEYAHYRLKTHPRHPMGSWHKGTNVNFAGTLFTLASNSAMKDQCAFVLGTFEYVPNWLGTVPGYGISGAGTTVSGEFYTHSIMGGVLVSQGQNALV